MIGMMIGKLVYCLDSFLKINFFTQIFIIDSVCDDGSTTVIVNIYLYTFESSLQIFNIALNFRVTG